MADVFDDGEKSGSSGGGGGCPTGCALWIAAVMFLWALAFGVTVGGKHYGVSCSKDGGVEIK